MPSVFAVESPSVTTLRALNYSPVLETFRRPHGGRKSLRLGDLVSSIGAAYGSMFTRIDCDPSHGVELVSQTDMFAAEPTGRVIRLDSMGRAERHRIERWQVLIAGAGTLGETELFGRSIIADDRLVGKYVSQHSLVLAFSEPGSVQNLYAYAFLCSGLGVSLTRSTSYGTKIMGLRKDAIANLHIPDADQSTKARISSLVQSAVEERGRYLSEIRKARQVIETLPEVQEALEECGQRRARFSVVAGPFVTIAARNHAALGPARDQLAKKWHSRLADLLEEGGIYNGPRFARTPCRKSYGIDFLDQRDVFAIRPVSRRIVEPRISKRLLYVPSHALIVASHGQLSEGSLFGHVETAAFGLHRCGITQQGDCVYKLFATKEIKNLGDENWALLNPHEASSNPSLWSCVTQSPWITQDILRVIPKPEHHDFLLAFLSSKLGFLLLKSTAIGTSIPMMHTGLLAELPYPPLTDSDRAEISVHVQAAIKARVDSEATENEAVRIIEQEVLPSWLA